MTRTRVYVDSVVDNKHVRVLISTDGRTEKPLIIEKEALEIMVESREEFWREVSIRGSEGPRRKERKLRRDIEGKVVLFPEADTPFFMELVKSFQRPPRLRDEKQVKIVRKRDIKRELKRTVSETGKFREDLRK
ncbi:MAG: hypothetical protein KAU48_07740, partial [Candidatus Thorarchaeota archaeon]|nr:hypothetical protein [Candidatus Thorarchaeota archaeon]